ncbi:hypothetical protein [Mucilaginibacter psychrotolerans]|uniref:Histidine kinase/HSP90-like ATPase domain-containing protein n=1 Tax=Mucilaginibacter psychrotolerans TaxID=1524096 RepID=A0A4Y8SLJ4_9SPHI|nr:hypothetical protein [Mucilaginibacter psychrotolerans]TFF39571.1 hypothetical protein E2R66_04140 [Mucilaginibacter psychrotolerans]
MPVVETSKFVFGNKAEQLYPLTMEILGHIENEVAIDEETAQKARMVLIELLTNAIKHGGAAECTLEVIAAEDKVIIKKSDIGEALVIRSEGALYQWPLPGVHQGGRSITIYGDGICNLKGSLANSRRVRFFIEENIKPNAGEIRNLPEHFGLMIITRACQAFEYEFDIATCTNNFTATLAVGLQTKKHTV